ncbi:expressed unknown protein [Seminavis robusta]|uniref:Arrestin C-terminal-like domain-containing protein n=1 Tax=Seminavis robusta TaxID=568900 RepID=A0A9N8H378_9STRA|nr:expressed unknown protein [Seminavis robusta]|eukprot:Sro32_g021140.1 n/a (350) ;mRNA; r:159160-160209
MHGFGHNQQTYREKNTFLNTKIPVEQSLITQKEEEEGHIQPGTYKIPFSFRVPAEIPASQKLGEYDSEASIIYSLRAVFGGSGVVLNDYQTKKVIEVVAAPEPPTRIVPAILKPQYQGITKNGLSNKGRVYVGAKVSQSRFTRGERPHICLAIINDSAASLHKIHMAVEQTAKWTARDFSSGTSKNLVTANYAIPSGYAPKVDETTRVQRANDKACQSKNMKQITSALNHEDGNNNNNTKALSFTLPAIPAAAVDTHSTSRIAVSHEIVVTLVTEGSKSDPSFRIPIHIGPGGPTVAAEPATGSSAAIPVANATPLTSSPRNTAARNYKTVGRPKSPLKTLNFGAIKLF